jgi:hypothetical protein
MVAVEASLLDLDEIKKDNAAQEFLKLGKDFTYTDQKVNNKKLLVQGLKGEGKKGEKFYAVRYLFGIQFKSKVKGDYSLIQTIDAVRSALDDKDRVLKDSEMPDSYVEGFPLKDGIANDGRGDMLNILCDSPATTVKSVVKSEAFIGKYKGKTVKRKTRRLGKTREDFKNVEPAKDTEGLKIEVVLTLAKDGKWSLKSSVLSIDEKDQIK